MNSSRLDQLKQFLEEDPDDPFNWYALALEYLKSDHREALRLFNKLLTEYKSYIPAYYHAGKLYLALNDPEAAARVFEEGIGQARQQNDSKALRELRSALDELLDT